MKKQQNYYMENKIDYTITSYREEVDYSVIEIMWISNTGTEINDRIIIKPNGSYVIYFDYQIGSLNNTWIKFYQDIIDMSKTEAFKLLYKK